MDVDRGGSGVSDSASSGVMTYPHEAGQEQEVEVKVLFTQRCRMWSKQAT